MTKPKIYPRGDAPFEEYARAWLGRRIVVTSEDYGVFFARVVSVGGGSDNITVDLEDPTIPAHFSTTSEVELAD